MSDLLVIVPSRGRPHNARALIDAWTATEATAELLFGIDGDDETAPDYPPPNSLVSFAYGERVGMCSTLNGLAVLFADDYRYIGFMGDDHRPRTIGWDRRITATLDELGTGIVYGNDLIHGEGLPTAVFMTADIIRAAGYMAPPRQHHLFLDNAWLALGHAINAIRYLPDIIIEHMHPLAGKAPTDDGYARVNANHIFEHDRAEFEQWRTHELPSLAEKIRASTPVR